jgi:soluble lytic murein transglycosylase-like protein
MVVVLAELPAGALPVRPLPPAAPGPALPAPERVEPIPKELPKGKLKSLRYPLVVKPPKASPAYERTFRILLSAPETSDRYDDLIVKYSRLHGLDPRLVKSIIAAESEFKPAAKSPAGALGLMQVLPATAESVGRDRHRLNDPEENIRAGTAYLAALFDRAFRRYKLRGVSYRDAPLWVVQRVIAAYHAGPHFLRSKWWLRQSRFYVRKVLIFYQSKVTDIRRQPRASRTGPKFGRAGLLY